MSARRSIRSQHLRRHRTSVRITGVNRELDPYIQRQLRTETSGAGYAQPLDFLQQLQAVYGKPGRASTLENAFNNFTTRCRRWRPARTLSARSGVISAAQSLTQQLNAMTQVSRRCAATPSRASPTRSRRERGDEADRDINDQLQNNGQRRGDRDAARPARPLYRSAVAVDGHQCRHERPQSGHGLHQLRHAAGRPRLAAFVRPAGHDDAEPLWNAPIRPSARSARSSIPQWRQFDLIAQAIRSGKIAAYSRCATDLVEAQAQLDEFAAAMASALSDKTTAGTARDGAAAGRLRLDWRLAVRQLAYVTYTDNITSARTISLMRVDDPPCCRCRTT